MKNEISNPASELTVGISYPNELFIEGIADVLEKHNFKVTFRASSMAGIYDACYDTTPDVVLVSTGLEGFSLDSVAYLAARATVIVMVSKTMPAISIDKTLNTGASGIISTDETIENYIQGIRAAIDGNFSISRELAKTIAGSDHKKLSDQPPTPILTSREAEVLALLGKGLTNREIGEELYISTYTVKAHMRNITIKLNLKNRHEASAYARSKQELLRSVIADAT